MSLKGPQNILSNDYKIVLWMNVLQFIYCINNPLFSNHKIIECLFKKLENVIYKSLIILFSDYYHCLYFDIFPCMASYFILKIIEIIYYKYFAVSLKMLSKQLLVPVKC